VIFRSYSFTKLTLVIPSPTFSGLSSRSAQ